MTPADVARNAKAVRNMASRLEGWGLDDAHRRAEHLAMNLASDGWRPLDKPEPEPAPTGRGSTDEVRRALIEKTKREIEERRRNRRTADPNGVTR